MISLPIICGWVLGWGGGESFEEGPNSRLRIWNRIHPFKTDLVLSAGPPN
jgi:hypothetical protein